MTDHDYTMAQLTNSLLYAFIFNFFYYCNVDDSSLVRNSSTSTVGDYFALFWKCIIVSNNEGGIFLRLLIYIFTKYFLEMPY